MTRGKSSTGANARKNSNKEAKTAEAAIPVPSKGFFDRLVLNLFIIEQLGLDTFAEHRDQDGHAIRPYRVLSAHLENEDEGLANDGRHHFYHAFSECDFFKEHGNITSSKLQQYEENIGTITKEMNCSRTKTITWKYYQWLELLFVEVYLDKYFNDRENLCDELNAFVSRFNENNKKQKKLQFKPIDPEGKKFYSKQDLNKVCIQSATGSGKTPLMVANYLQYRNYENMSRKADEDNGLTLLLTPRESLSEQDSQEFNLNGVYCVPFSKDNFTNKGVMSIEVTKLAEEVKGKNDDAKSVSVDWLGNRNLLFIDEGHAGLSGKDAGAWYTRRSKLCTEGFAFEYSATFKQAVVGKDHEDDYAKAILFDYSYHCFYEDGYGKDYRLYNLPEKETDYLDIYMSAGLLKFYQQLKLFEDMKDTCRQFQIEKPLWAWVGHSVTGGTSKEDKLSLSDVEQVLRFFARFLADPASFINCFRDLITKKGEETGLLDKSGHDMFSEAFDYIAKQLESSDDSKWDALYNDILNLVFHAQQRGERLKLQRVEGDSGEILLRVADSKEPFGEINVSATCDLCAKVKENPELKDLIDVSERTVKNVKYFENLRNSDSPMNILIGAKRFIEGWDCWRVSMIGMMHFGQKEGIQLVQLFGRGVRLKGYLDSLKRSEALKRSNRLPIARPSELKELETLCVFGVSADALVPFKKELEEMGCPINDHLSQKNYPLTLSSDLREKHLKILIPKNRKDNGRRYDFKSDGKVPQIDGNIPEIIEKNKVVVDRYPKIIAAVSDELKKDETGRAKGKEEGKINGFVEYLDFQQLYYTVEKWKRQYARYNLNCTQEGLKALFEKTSWYTLFIPQPKLDLPGFNSFDDIRAIQDIANELLRGYLDKYYGFCADAYLKPRLEYQELDETSPNIPEEREYQIIYKEGDASLAAAIDEIISKLKSDQYDMRSQMGGIVFLGHLYNPLFFNENDAVKILPTSLNASEFCWVRHLAKYIADHPKLKEKWGDIYLLRNQSRGKGIGFFEANHFYPDFIMWCVKDNMQFVTFIEPHGLQKEGGQEHAKVIFCRNDHAEGSIKRIQERLGNPNVILNCFIITPTPFEYLKWGKKQEELKHWHILFQQENNGDEYISDLFDELGKEIPAPNNNTSEEV